MREGWILAGELDGIASFPTLDTRICHLPHGERLVRDLRAAGADRVYVIWNQPGALPTVRGATTVTAPPAGDARDRVVVTRADRICHRALARLVVDGGEVATVTGHDAVVATDRATAREMISRSRAPRGLALALAELRDRTTFVDAPAHAFTLRASGPSSLRAAEHQLLLSIGHHAGDVRTLARAG